MKKLAEEVGLQLTNIADKYPEIFVLDGDLADSDGAFYFADAFPERFLMSGISEQNMISMAAGMASTGKRPFAFSFAAFLCYRAYDQIRVSICQTKMPVTLVGSHAGGLAGRNGKTHTAVNDMAVMLTLPDMPVWAPADNDDVTYMLSQIMSHSEPAYIRASRSPIGEQHALGGKPSELRWVYPKRKINIVSCGIASQWSKQVIEQLHLKECDIGLLHCLHVNNIEKLRHELTDSEQLIVIEDHCQLGGLASLVQLLNLKAHISSFGWPVSFCGKSGDDEQLRDAHGLSQSQLAQAILKSHFPNVKSVPLKIAEQV